MSEADLQLTCVDTHIETLQPPDAVSLLVILQESK